MKTKIGDKFGVLTVISNERMDFRKETSPEKKRLVDCECSCGNIIITDIYSLRNKLSCGCKDITIKTCKKFDIEIPHDLENKKICIYCHIFYPEDQFLIKENNVISNCCTRCYYNKDHKQIIIKKCNICGEFKTLNDFFFKSNSCNYSWSCKECILKATRKSREENKIKNQIKRQKRYDQLNPNKDKRICNICNIEYNINKYIIPNEPGKLRHFCKKCLNNKNKKRKDKNRDHYRKIANTWYHKNKRRILNNPKYKIRARLRARLKAAILSQNPNGKKQSSIIKYLSCDILFLKEYLKKHFVQGMSFDNMSEWDIDHIIPCEVFDLENEQQIKQCFNYTNLCPAFEIINNSKGDHLLDGRQARNLSNEDKQNLISQYFDSNNHLKETIKNQYIEKFYS